MRADRRPLVRGLATALLALIPTGVQAQGLTGFAQTQVQVFDQNLLRTDGTIQRQRIQRYTQTIELQHFANPRPDLRIMSSFRISDLAYRSLPDRSHQPQGTLQVSHPWANLFLAYRPTTVTGGLSPSGSSPAGDTARAVTLTSRAQEMVLTGQIAPPSWPRLDVAWTRRHRDRDLISADEVGIMRSARLAWSNDLLNVYSGWSDQATAQAGVSNGITQRSANLGGSLHLVPMHNANLDLSLDANDSRAGDPHRQNGSSRGYTGSLNSAWRPNTMTTGSATWLWRRGETRGPRPTLTEDHEASLQVSVDPAGPLRLVMASGARTLRTPQGRRLASSVSGVGSLEGHVREGWTGVTTFTHVTNWAPGLRVWSVEAMRAASQMQLLHGLDVMADAQISTSDDTTLRDVNTTTEATAQVRATPWRSLTLGWNTRASRSGDAILHTHGGSALSSAWDMRWHPLRTIECMGTSASTRGRGGERSTTRTLNVRWAPFTNLQATADWSRSNDRRNSAFAQSVTGREIVSLHVLALIGRRVQVDASAGVAERATPRENRQGSVTVTWAFGR